jgi:hypothetical protein
MSVEWLAGMGLTLIGIVGGIIARDRYIFSKISECEKNISKSERNFYEKLAEVKHEYVRRDDLDNWLKRVEETLTEIKQEQVRTNEKIFELITK